MPRTTGRGRVKKRSVTRKNKVAKASGLKGTGSSTGGRRKNGKQATDRNARGARVRRSWLKKNGLTRVPAGKQIGHKVSMRDGGSDSLSNVKLVSRKKNASDGGKNARHSTKGKRRKLA